MKKAKRIVEEGRVKDALLRAERLLGIQGKYEFTIILDWGYDGDHEFDDQGVTSVSLTCATTNANWQYMRARIRYYMPVVVCLSDERLFAVVVHEFVHVLLNPLDSFVIFDGDSPRSSDASKANEFTTESVTRAILSAAGQPYPATFHWLDEV